MATPATEVEAVFHDGSFHPLNGEQGQWNEGQHVRLLVHNAAPEEKPAPRAPRVPGLHAGLGWMSDDFNAPLPDEFWLGEE